MQIPFVLSPSLHRILLLNSISLRPSDALFQFCYECIPVIMIVFSNETVADVARRVRRALGSIQRRMEGSVCRVKVTHATAKNPFVEDRTRLLKSENSWGMCGGRCCVAVAQRARLHAPGWREQDGGQCYLRVAPS